MEHTVESFFTQRGALLQQGPGAALYAFVGQQVGGSRHLVREHERRYGLAVQFAAREQSACKAGADESARAGYQQFHGVPPLTGA